MRRGGHRGDPHVRGRAGHGDRAVHVAGTVVDSGQDVGVDVYIAVQREDCSRSAGAERGLP